MRKGTSIHATTRGVPISVCFPYTNRDDGASVRSELTEPNEDGHESIREATMEPLRDRDLAMELVDMKLQIARQSEEIDRLSSSLARSRAEVAALNAENGCLVDRLALARDNKEGRPASPASLAISSIVGALSGGAGGGSMQVLVDVNAKLMADNARLEVSVDSLRNAFVGYIRSGERNVQEERERCESLQRENEALRQRLRPMTTRPEKSHLEENTAETSLASEIVGSVIDINQSESVDFGLKDSQKFSPKHDAKQDVIGNVCTTKKGEEAGKAVEESSRHEADDLIVGFGESRRSRRHARRWTQ